MAAIYRNAREETMLDVLSNLADGEALHVLSSEPSLDFEIENVEELLALRERSIAEGKVNITAWTLREDILMAMCGAEHTFFPSYDPDLSKLWDVRMVTWRDTLWQVVTIPRSYLPAVKEYLFGYKMKLQDGVPTMIDSSGTYYFPINSANTFNVGTDPGEAP